MKSIPERMKMSDHEIVTGHSSWATLADQSVPATPWDDTPRVDRQPKRVSVLAEIVVAGLLDDLKTTSPMSLGGNNGA